MISSLGIGFFALMNATGTSPRSLSTFETTAASTTFLRLVIAFSISAVESRWPATLIMSSLLPRILKFPCASLKALSPARYVPCPKYFLNLFSFFQTPRINEGLNGDFWTNNPSFPAPTLFPLGLTISNSIPGKGFAAYEGMKGPIPGRALITAEPVSVCQYVSIIGQRFFPMFLKNHIHVASSIGSPTLPNIFNESIFRDLVYLVPVSANILKAVGAV